MGLCHAFPFIIIAALTSHSNIHNRQEKLSLTDVQASYMASVGYIAEPLGSVLSAFFTGKLWFFQYKSQMPFIYYVVPYHFDMILTPFSPFLPTKRFNGKEDVNVYSCKFLSKLITFFWLFWLIANTIKTAHFTIRIFLWPVDGIWCIGRPVYGKFSLQIFC